MQIRDSLLLILILIGGLCGCQNADYTAANRYDRGLVLCLGGVGGVTGEVDRIRKGLDKGAVDWALEEFKWSRYNALDDQADVKENKLKAYQLARRVEAYRRDYPQGQVYLVGVSAGTGLVVWALEELAAGEKADGAILIASSLKRNYDLSTALQNVNGQIHSFYSPTDPVLRLGVPLAGSVDRKHSLASGGADGFKAPAKADEYVLRLYRERLRQYRWGP